MGCGASTPVKGNTSAASAAELRTKDTSQKGPTFDVGPNYKMGKHLGAGTTPHHRGAPYFSSPLLSAIVLSNPCWRCTAAGKGGTGDTWSFTDKRTGREVAIKFIKRPMPKVLVQNIQREFTVRRPAPRPPPHLPVPLAAALPLFGGGGVCV